MNNFKNHAKQYIDAGFSVIPDKYGQKGAAIKEWTKYAHQMPTLGEIDAWSNAFEETNISVMLGEISGIIALDLDATDARILETVLPLLPDSPVVKRGAKGETRFYKYSGEMSQNIKFNGEMVLELLSTGKKTTLPPSIHPNGMSYTWVSDNLLSCNINNLPIVPPMLFSHLESLLKLKFPDLANESGKITSGRNAELSSYCAKLIQERIPIRDSIDKLIQFDKDKHEVPLFSDINELRHSEPFTNALQFYANHLSTINSKKFQKKEPYEVPLSGDLGKLQGRSAEVSEKSHAVLPASLNLPQPSGVLKLLIDNLMSNMYIKQPEFAHAAALTLLAGLVSRKFIYSDLSPNLYTLILGDSGCVDGDTEFLSPSGWVKIKDWHLHQVMQYDKDTGNATFVKPQRYIKLPTTELTHFKTKYGIDQVLCDDHNVLYSVKGNLITDKFKNVKAKHLKSKKGFGGRFLTTFEYSGGNPSGLTEAELRLQIAYNADGDTKNNFITLKKEDKKQRLVSLLHTSGTEYRRSDYSTGYSRFYFKRPRESKRFGNISDYSLNELKIIAEECVMWDGDRISSYRTSIKEDADFIQTVFTILGKRTTIHTCDRRDIHKGIYYEVRQAGNTLVGITSNTPVEMAPFKTDFKYCFTVDTGYLVLRRNDKIFITGNCGKNAPLQWVKRTLLAIGAEDLLGAGDFVSDASLIDSLNYRPVRVDVVDEASKLLQVTNGGNNSYDGKMSDILCELYTSSNDKFLGRAMASQDGSMRIKGACYRPNVNMICGTTPSGFSHAVTHKSIEKGLLGRFLIFFGAKDEIIDPVEYTTPLPEEAISTLKAIHAFAPSSSIHLVGGISQNVEMLTASEAARTQLNQVFTEVNALRSASHSAAVKPVIARIYQQIIKIAILHCVGRWKNGMPNIEVEDVVFAKDLIYYCFNNFNTVLDRYLFNSNTERYAKLVLRVIQENGEISRPSLIYQTLALSNKERDEALKTLEACNQIMVDLVTTSNKEKQFVYRSIV